MKEKKYVGWIIKENGKIKYIKYLVPEKYLNSNYCGNPYDIDENNMPVGHVYIEHGQSFIEIKRNALTKIEMFNAAAYFNIKSFMKVSLAYLDLGPCVDFYTYSEIERKFITGIKVDLKEE